mmetsp:Transcript_1563/g.3145  ORF Transcript_1563/g.3145 Transcript_1563/m.3145 type:complete len:83 (-) Transcript_1563:38-286(-)
MFHFDHPECRSSSVFCSVKEGWESLISPDKIATKDSSKPTVKKYHYADDSTTPTIRFGFGFLLLPRTVAIQPICLFVEREIC